MINRREFLLFSMGILFDLSLGKELYGKNPITYKNFSKNLLIKSDGLSSVGKKVTVILDEEPELILHTGCGDFNYPVVVGKRGYPTPKGDFKILRKERHPLWCPDPDRKWVQNIEWYMKYYNETGKRCVPYTHSRHPLGSWKFVFKPHGYAIHGRGDATLDKGIRYASHGCVRMRNEDIDEIAPLLEIGTPITIY